MIGTALLSKGSTLCDLEPGGGGPGGGGGSGIPGSHLDWDVDRERADVGVSMAPVEAARRAAGGAFWTMLWEGILSGSGM